MPEFEPMQYVINVHLGQPVPWQQQWQSGKSIAGNQMYGDVSIYPTAQTFREAWSAESEFLEIYLAPALFSQAADECNEAGHWEILPQASVRDPLIQQLGLSLKAELESTLEEPSGISQVRDRLFVESAASLLVAHLIKQYSSRTPTALNCSGRLPRYKLQATIDYIQAHLGEDISLETLAQEAGMSMHHFSRLFKRSLGYSPYQYVLKCRIDRAKLLLSQRQLSIADVAFAVGFTSQSHFTQHFKQLIGITPKQFLNR